MPQPLREERNQRLLQLVNEIAARRYEALVGTPVQVLVEGPSKRNAARWTGRTPCNKIVVFENPSAQRGALLNLRITRAGSFTLYGEAPAH